MTIKKTDKRPFLLYLVIAVFVFGGFFSLVQTLGVIRSWVWWLSFKTIPPIVFQIFQGVLISLAWISAAVLLWLRLPWAVSYSGLVVLFITVWGWINRLALTNNPLPFSRHVLALLVTFVFLLFVFCSLYLVAPFMKPNQRSSKEEGTISIQSTGDQNE